MLLYLVPALINIVSMAFSQSEFIYLKCYSIITTEKCTIPPEEKWSIFISLDSDYRVQPVPFPLSGGPRKSSNHGYLRHFYRSDHYSFWKNTVPFKAVMLTDTSNFRRIMDKCYHRKCDSMKRIKKNDLEFLRRNINAVIQTTLELSKAGIFLYKRFLEKSRVE